MKIGEHLILLAIYGFLIVFAGQIDPDNIELTVVGIVLDVLLFDLDSRDLVRRPLRRVREVAPQALADTINE